MRREEFLREQVGRASFVMQRDAEWPHGWFKIHPWAITGWLGQADYVAGDEAFKVRDLLVCPGKALSQGTYQINKDLEPETLFSDLKKMWEEQNNGR